MLFWQDDELLPDACTSTSITALIAATQSAKLFPVSTYWPSQKTAPSGAEHWASQPPWRRVSHIPVQFTSQSALATAVHRASQLASHFAWQVAVAGST
jgi:hypothetical protein